MQTENFFVSRKSLGLVYKQMLQWKWLKIYDFSDLIRMNYGDAR
jgi:hypothetical protein